MTDRIRVGNVEIVAVLDMVPPPRDPTVFITDVPRDAWKPYEDEVLENGMLQLYYGCFFLRSQGKTVLGRHRHGPRPALPSGRTVPETSSASCAPRASERTTWIS